MVLKLTATTCVFDNMIYNIFYNFLTLLYQNYKNNNKIINLITFFLSKFLLKNRSYYSMILSSRFSKIGCGFFLFYFLHFFYLSLFKY